MDLTLIIIIAAAALLLGGVAAMLIITVPIAKRVYRDNIVRQDGKWGRECSAPDNAEQAKMWEDACRWSEQNSDKMHEVSIQNDGVTLVGEYYDFASDRCVIIIPGRSESLRYSCYFAKPYADAGCSVLVIDMRAHGLSGGEYSTLGVAESEDLECWIKLIKEKFGIKKVFIHAICVGTSTAMLAMDKPDSGIDGLITEGCFVTYKETFKRHMIYENHPVFPVLGLSMHFIQKHTGTNIMKTAPINVAPRLTQPVLFIYGRQDFFSLPKKSEKLFAAYGGSDKHIVWFDKGLHSHLRINNVKEYDKAIAEFLKSH